VVVTGIHEGLLELAWFLPSHRSFVAYLDPIASKKELS
jgi:hypothetical protein